MLSWTKTMLAGMAGLALLGSDQGTIAQPSPSPVQSAIPRAIAITEAEVRAILEQIIAASRKQDGEEMSKFLAPNATIDITVQTVAGSRKLSLTRQQYIAYLKQGRTMIEQHQANYSDIKIRVNPDGKTAVATYTVQESSRLKSQAIVIASVSNETVTFQRVQGQLQATALRAIARVEINQN